MEKKLRKILRVLQSMYSKVSLQVKISRKEATEAFLYQRGVRQGCNLSSLLFSLFTSGLEEESRKNNAGIQLHNISMNILFVDDLFIYNRGPKKASDLI